MANEVATTKMREKKIYVYELSFYGVGICGRWVFERSHNSLFWFIFGLFLVYFWFILVLFCYVIFCSVLHCVADTANN